jgi:hypothetical protein
VPLPSLSAELRLSVVVVVVLFTVPVPVPVVPLVGAVAPICANEKLAANEIVKVVKIAFLINSPLFDHAR